MERILVVEDNKIVNMTLTRILQGSNYRVDSVYNAEDAMDEISRRQYDLIILDLNLPHMNGYKFLQVIRKKSDVPVIINTAHSTVRARVKLINAGASDFIEKSYSSEEILESVRIILEDRRRRRNRKLFSYNNLEIDFSTRTAMKNGEMIDLTSKEMEILKVLYENPERAFSREQLYLVVWGQEYKESVDNTINVHIKTLRNKIEDNPKKPDIIQTVFGYGYRLGKAVADQVLERY